MLDEHDHDLGAVEVERVAEGEEQIHGDLLLEQLLQQGLVLSLATFKEYFMTKNKLKELFFGTVSKHKSQRLL